MPLHPHHCPACGADFEVLTLRISQDPDPTCDCGAKAERRFGVPLLKTNTAFFTGNDFGAAQFAGANPSVQAQYVKQAEAAGVSVNGKRYMHGLARFPGDPQAWVNDLGDAKRLLRQRGWGCEELGVKGDRREEAPDVPIAPDLVEERLDEMVMAGEIHESERGRHREAVAEKMAPDWSPPVYTADDLPERFRPAVRPKSKIKVQT